LGREGGISSIFSLGRGDRRLFATSMCRFPVKLSFSFPPIPAKSISDVLMNRQSDPSIRFAYSRCEHLKESSNGGNWRGCIYILNRQGGSNLQDEYSNIWGLHGIAYSQS
jgi:hypothetical protein